jgi:hypothetical protein
MNFADIENTWRSPHNRPSPSELEKQKVKFITDLKRRRRGNLFFLGLILSLLLFITGKVVLHVLWPDPGLDTVDLAREWGIVPFFALPWIGWFVLVYLHWRNQARYPEAERSISVSIAALLDENRAERTRNKVIAALLVTSVLLLPLIVGQLRAVGKVGDEMWIPAYVIYPTYVFGILVWAWFHHRRRLLPRKRELETLLKSYE